MNATNNQTKRKPFITGTAMEDVWCIKEEIAAEAGYDGKEMAHRLREKEAGDPRFFFPSQPSTSSTDH